MAEVGTDTRLVATNSLDVGAELDAFNKLVKAMQDVEQESRPKLLRMLTTLFDLEATSGHVVPTPHPAARPASWGSNGSAPQGGVAPFSEDRSITPKEFLLQKKPLSDVERIACLAYYLTHYRDTPHFKTLDLSKLNTEAAQTKFSNAAQAVDNATKAGLLVPAAKGNKQVSAAGELYVQALPDRAAAKEAMSQFRQRRKTRRTRATNGGASTSADRNGTSAEAMAAGEE